MRMGMGAREIRKLLALTATGALLTGCASIQSMLPGGGPGPAAVSVPGTQESVQAAAIGQGQAVFWVGSNGCTTRDDLMPVVSQYRGAATITLWRVSEDDCDAPVPGGVEVRWTFEEMGLPPGTDVRVGNSYERPPT
ncbi:hypothetical protein [Brevundimonas sp.]|uniref:hypothetical protein n=1 Tax=Brevundimonas sp. TaxID=1871086 RepID=UPI0024886F11|nr:hypothetical protein [Brevundimonas sp.]MDI1282479.1 hypothetical protein [Brevundimonas sp.]